MSMLDRSGKVESSSKTVYFLYDLMRDYITPGTVELIMSKIEDTSRRETTIYINGWLARHAIDVAKRLEGDM